MVSNQELVEKAGEIQTTSMVNGGTLNAKQQTRFIELIRSYGNLMGRVRFIRMTQPNQEIDKLHLGEPVTRQAIEASSQVSVGGSATSYTSGAPDYPYKIVPKFNKIALQATKVRSDWGISTETLQSNIAGNSIEGTVMSAIAERMAHDMEEMGINGDTSVSVATSLADAPLNHLRKILNGWDVLTNDAIILDVNGSYISKSVWNDMIRIQPKEYKADAGKMFICSDNVAQDWAEMLSERATPLGDAQLQGTGIAPFGIPMIRSSIIRDDKPLTASPAYAKVVSGHFGPYNITSTANRIQVLVDGATTNEIVLPVGTWDTNQIVAFLTPLGGFGTVTADANGQTSKKVLIGTTSYNATYFATDGTTPAVLDANWRVAEIGDGRFVIYSNATASQAVAVEAPSANNAAGVLGLSDAGASNYLSESSPTTNLEGSFIWLANPRNFIWGVLDGTRIYTEYNKDSDVIESVIFNQVAAAVENTRAVVKAINVRAKTGWPV